ncbi:MAG: NupC/NupG family nucleoside CNT transporter [Gammaproteobacteria bacterium]|nr:NupC/NupG family nucleoside CNT transporter [Gammaproteobacteria bacterium]MDH5630881.1 NupC/NupG family nucleoside CNT transporter [Gammaproteobacteria bacterium]
MTTIITMLGMAFLLGTAFLLSSNRKMINLRTVSGAFGLQLLIGALVLYIPAGKDILVSVSNAVSNVITYGQAGISFLFGKLSTSDEIGFVFALNVLPIIVFFSSLVAVLYYLGIMGWIIRILGGGLQKLLGTSRPESLSAAANVFVGQTEAPLVVRPFIPQMTQSELFAVMVGGLSTVAGSILLGYASLGVEMKYLIAASFMAAPGGFLMAKMIVPETQKPNNLLEEIKEEEDKPVNVIDAAAMGASNGLKLALNVGAMLLAFIALIALLNGILGWFGGYIDQPDLSIQQILGYLFAPVAWLLGIPWSEAVTSGSFIGQKLVVNEFVAYIDFVNHKQHLSEYSQVVITFALCGFANLSSIAILLGGLGVMAPNRRKDIARLGLKAVMAGSMANLMSAAIAGFLFSIS